MGPFEVLYGRKYITILCWSELDKTLIIWSELGQQTNAKLWKIQECIKATNSRPKSYDDRRRALLEFQVRDRVFLKVSPVKGVMKFNFKGKLSPRYNRPCEIIEMLNPVAYRMDLLVELEHMQNIIHFV